MPNCAPNRSAKLQQRLAGRLEQQVVEHALVLPDQRVERVRQGEDQMKYGTGSSAGRLLVQPVHGRRALALRAMAVAAGVGHEMFAPHSGTGNAARPARGVRQAARAREHFPLVGRERSVRRRSARQGHGRRICPSVGRGVTIGGRQLGKVQQLQRAFNLGQPFLPHVQVGAGGGQAARGPAAVARP